jgi:capsular polysaccharide transport system permease protein
MTSLASRSVATGKLPTPRIVFALIMREMSTTYGRSWGGYLWAILEPVAAIGLLTVVLSQAFRSPPIGSSFVLFYATGYLPFMVYNDISSKISLSLMFSRQLLLYPAVTFMDAIVARFLLNLFTQIVVVIIVLYGITRFEGGIPHFSLEPMILAIAMATSLAFAVGTMNCLITAYLPVWQQVWSILNRPLFLISCIFFTFQSLPLDIREILWYNPLIHVVGMMREGAFPTYDSSHVSPLYIFGICGIVSVVSLFFLKRYHREIINDF